MKPTDVTIIRRQVKAIAVPFGNEIELMPGQEVLVTQDKGGSFTLNVNGNLLHLDGKDADAIGKQIVRYPVEGMILSQVIQLIWMLFGIK